MSTSPTGTTTISNASQGKEFNEFARIEGLGPAMQRWLRETFQVYTIADLANLSVNRVLSRLEDEEKDFCHREIEHWIQQAQEFAAQHSSWRTFATFVVSLQSRQIGGQTDQRTTAYFLEADRRAIWSGIECNGVYELMLDQLKHILQLQPEGKALMESESMSDPKPSNANSSGTEPMAASAEDQQESELENQVVQSESVTATPSESETGLHTTDVELAAPDIEQDKTPAPETDESIKLMIDSLLGAEAESEVLEPIALKITQLKIYQPRETEELEPEEPEVKKTKSKKMKSKQAESEELEEPEQEKAIVVNLAKRSLVEMLRREDPFQIEVTFEITGTGATPLTNKPLHYQVQCFIQNRATLEKMQLESSAAGVLTKGTLTYTSRLPAITIRHPDVYRFQIVTRLQGRCANPDLLELPFVQIG